MPDDVPDRIWMRCGVGILAATGGARWRSRWLPTCLPSNRDRRMVVLAAAPPTIAMCVIPALSLRELRSALRTALSMTRLASGCTIRHGNVIGTYDPGGVVFI